MSPPQTKRRPARHPAPHSSLIEHLEPIVALHASVRDRGSGVVDVAAARARIRAGRTGFDAQALLDGAPDLDRAVGEAAAVFERVGVASTAQLAALRESSFDPWLLLASWVNGDTPSRRPGQRVARQVAAVVGNAVLSRAARDIAEGFSFAPWKRANCPCCGASPDTALNAGTRRALVCWRCDTLWRTNALGCLGCGASQPPTLVRVPSPYGYELAICHSCGRYVKERRGVPAHGWLVERALTAGLDEAAEQRGLRV